MKLSLAVCLILCSCSSVDPIAAEVNRDISSKISYKSDIEAHGVKDYWQSPRQTLQLKTGDCEDFAILQANILHTKYNIPSSKIKYAYFKNSVEGHMVVLYNNIIIDYDGVYEFSKIYKERFAYVMSFNYHNTRTEHLY